MVWIRDNGNHRGMTHAKKKKFSGKTFLRFGVTQSKKDAQKKGKYLKEKGIKYRIEKTKDGYTLWWNKKEQKKSTVFVKGVGQVPKKTYDAIRRSA